MSAILISYIKKINAFYPKKNDKKRLHSIIDILNDSIKSTKNIVFICTHNSRRSQFCEIWGNVFSKIYNKKLNVYSAGLKKTSVYKGVIFSLSRTGLKISGDGKVKYEENEINLTSKTLDDIKEQKFIGVMTCSNAEKSCPIDQRSIKNINMFYKDPKDFEAYTEAVVNSVETARGASGLGTAFGRGLAELITTGKYQTIDLSCFGLDRIFAKQKRTEPYVL